MLFYRKRINITIIHKNVTEPRCARIQDKKKESPQINERLSITRGRKTLKEAKPGTTKGFDRKLKLASFFFL